MAVTTDRTVHAGVKVSDGYILRTCQQVHVCIANPALQYLLTHCKIPTTSSGKTLTTCEGKGRVTTIIGRNTHRIATKNIMLVTAKTLTDQFSAFCTTFARQNKKAHNQRIHSRRAASMILPTMET